MMKINDVCNYLGERFPLENALDFDKAVGLAIGARNIEVTGIMLALDLNEEVIKEAVNNNCNLIISHHPFLFSPIYRVLYDDYKGKIIKLMIENNLSLYTMHTNLDCGFGGVNDALANLLGLSDIKVVNDEPTKGNLLRFGKIEDITLGELVSKVKKAYNLSGVRVLGDLNKTIKKVGVVGGSGARDEEIMLAKKCGCDCYITGEVHLNNAQYAEFLDISLIEVNHGVEKFVFDNLKEELSIKLKDLYKYNGPIVITKNNSDGLVSM